MKKDIFNGKIIYNKSPSLEAQVSAISDDIAYNNHDLEDGLRAGLFELKNLKEIPFVSKVAIKHINNSKNFRKEIIISQIVRELINYMVSDVIKKVKKT